ncbi:adenylyltransferase/cytidyltransferase family protein [Patescibacteria group bacterium]
MVIDLASVSDVEMVRASLDGKNVGLTSGTFDLFHHLHLVYLTRCRRMCDVLIVGVDNDDLVMERKGPERPLVPEHQRVAIVNALSCVQIAFILGTVDDFARAVDVLNVSVIFKNQDFKEEEVLGRDKARVVIVPDMIQHSSTSQIIGEILKRKNAKGE